ncbi:hypothetical protein [Streptosporangium canum]|uniref:hypothetical protein n=1 Tax=Streptosporangium canum TaxID=324952 RepID=UPI003797456A
MVPRLFWHGSGTTIKRVILLGLRYGLADGHGEQEPFDAGHGEVSVACLGGESFEVKAIVEHVTSDGPGTGDPLSGEQDAEHSLLRLLHVEWRGHPYLGRLGHLPVALTGQEGVSQSLAHPGDHAFGSGLIVHARVAAPADHLEHGVIVTRPEI